MWCCIDCVDYGRGIWWFVLNLNRSENLKQQPKYSSTSWIHRVEFQAKLKNTQNDLEFEIYPNISNFWAMKLSAAKRFVPSNPASAKSIEKNEQKITKTKLVINWPQSRIQNHSVNDFFSFLLSAWHIIKRTFSKALDLFSDG